MTQWWESETPNAAQNKVRAVAYYRHSAQDRQENSIPIQREQVREWAMQHGVEIIQEFSDHGKSGLTAEGRPAFNEMMDDWVALRDDFQYILCLDVSRWGRFQDIDLSAQYSAICKKHHKQVIYTTIGKPREDDPLYPVYVQFERFRAAQYSRELSEKVWRGCVKIAEQGYWAGGAPPYGLRRLLLDETREPIDILQPGQRKGIQNQRVTLTEGPPNEVAVIRRIFEEFVEQGYSEHRIAEGLNRDNIPSPSGNRWGAGAVVGRLRNEKYTGTMLYNQTTQRLKTPTQRNPPDEWVRTPEAFEGIISPEMFTQAQRRLEQRRRKYDPDHMLRQLDALYQRHGLYCPSLLRCQDEAPGGSAYARTFGSLDFAFQALHSETRDRALKAVHDRIRGVVSDVIQYEDFLVLDRKLTLAIQPAVPVPHGYTTYWPFRRDRRRVIDLTLGVLLSEPSEAEIMGYITLPRWLTDMKTFRFFDTSPRLELFGRGNLDFLQQLLCN